MMMPFSPAEIVHQLNIEAASNNPTQTEVWTEAFNAALVSLKAKFPQRTGHWYDREAEKYADRKTTEWMGLSNNGHN